jgi:hypothetical protein
MAVDILDNPNSTGYEYFKQFRRDIRYVRTYYLEESEVILKSDLPNYPQTRKNKRDNFKIK